MITNAAGKGHADCRWQDIYRMGPSLAIPYSATIYRILLQINCYRHKALLPQCVNNETANEELLTLSLHSLTDTWIFTNWLAVVLC